MNTLRTARVVVIDENRDESSVLQQALGTLGIGSVLITGELEQLPKSPLEGIRLVFLDLQLTSQVESVKYIDETVAVLRKAVQMVPGGVGIICWTKHEDDISMLKTRLTEAGIDPAFLESIPDKKRLVDAALAELQTIIARIDAVLATLHGRRLLFEWEQVMHNAVTGTTNRLFGTALGSANFDDEVLRRVGAVANAAAEEKIKTPEQAATASFVGLSPLVLDTAETVMPVKGPQHEKLFAQIQGLRKAPLNAAERATLNSVLLSGEVGTDLTARPGNLYIERGWNPPDQFPLRLETSQRRALIREVFRLHGDAGDTGARIDGLMTGLLPCLLEVTPACDHSAGKAEYARLLPGILLPLPDRVELESERALPAESRTFAKDTEYFDIKAEALTGAYRVIVLARRVVGLGMKELARNTPLVRLRHPVIADIRAWFASHAARPGYVSIR